MTTVNAGQLARALKRIYSKGMVARVTETPDVVPDDDLLRYKHDLVGFAHDVLGITLTADQQRITSALPGRVKVNSGHGVGKTLMAAVVTLWWFHTRNPGIVVTTGPTKHHVDTVLWTEIRMLAMRAARKLPSHFMPKASKIFDHPDHWAEGVTAATGEGFQGRHRPSMCFIFDECEDIDPIYWSVTDTMYQPGQDHAWFAIGNPITTSSQSFLEDIALAPDGGSKWQLFTLSCLNHPNIPAQLQGLAPPIPHAVSLPQVQQWFLDWTTPVMAADRTEGDVEWPPGSGVYYRPGPTFKARVMGIRPTEGVDTVWSMAAWERMLLPAIDHRFCWETRQGITIGVDPAAYGDDFTTFHVRTGGLSLYHEARNGWGPDRVAGRLKELCREWAIAYNSWASTDRPPIKAGDVRCVVELDGGLGVAVMSHRGHDAYWNWQGVTVGGASNALDPGGGKLYGNVRAQMWLEGAKLAAAGGMDISRLPPEVRGRLRVQLLAPYYEVRPDGSRLVESKADLKARLGRSPDDADGLLVSHYRAPSSAPTLVLADQNPW